MRAAAPLLGIAFTLGLALGASLMWAFQEPGHHWYETFVKHTPDWFVALFTLTLTVSTYLLWGSTADLAREARDSSDRLLKMETPYVSGGGDFVKTNGVELFRLDVENHGKTPAFITAYDLQFAKLAELQEEERQKQKPRASRERYYRHIEGLSAMGARKNIFTQIPIEKDADIVFGAVWYEDPILVKEHYSRFILRIAPHRDIPGHGLTRLDVEGVSNDYWSWDYQENRE